MITARSPCRQHTLGPFRLDPGKGGTKGRGNEFVLISRRLSKNTMPICERWTNLTCSRRCTGLSISPADGTFEYLFIFFGVCRSRRLMAGCFIDDNATFWRWKKKQQLDLLEFITSISESLIKCQKSPEPRRKPGRPPSRKRTSDSISPLSDVQPKQAPKRRRRTPVSVQNDVRLDQCGHFPEYRANKPRCAECSKPMRMGCMKCKVGLCVEKDRNCYLAFHTA